MLWCGSVGLALLSGCYAGSGSFGESDGSGGDAGEGGDGEVDPPSEEELAATGVSGVRRLTASEWDTTITDLLGIELPPSSSVLPEDPLTPFDNDFQAQNPSKGLIEGAELLAAQAAEAVLADAALRDQLVGCDPVTPTDEMCMTSFVETFGRRAFRRPLTEQQVERFVALGVQYGQAEDDFYVGVDTVLRGMLQHPQFLYRVELGTPVPDQEGVFRLDDYEVGTRLSYFLWGSTPNDWLLDEAEAGNLSSPDGVATAARTMLSDNRARDRLIRFHALWLGYEALPHEPSLAIPMKAETDALIERVLFDESGQWHDLLTYEETFVNDTLATHYGLTPPGSTEGVWVPYGGSERRGLFSHGSFLSIGAKFDDTSPVQRGLIIRTRLFCQEIQDPPPDVNADDPIPDDAGPCKKDRYAVHSQGGCAGCHELMDPIGFGLENYDQTGAFRTHDNDLPECTIDGDGAISGVGEFNGPAELGELVLSDGTIDRCVMTQLYRFAMGRYELEDQDEAFIDLMMDRITEGESFALEDMIVAFASEESFGLRREEESE